jgi:alpha-beta hydrolase superfamily lysophospholipase
VVATGSRPRGRAPIAEEIVIRADDVRLAATLWMPAAGGAEHIVVMVHGSGDMTRDNDVYFRPIRDELLRAGIGALGYDKRGVGGSTGDWTTSNLRHLAGDAVAAVAFLRSRSDTAGASIGLSATARADGSSRSPRRCHRRSTGS